LGSSPTLDALDTGAHADATKIDIPRTNVQFRATTRHA
jgi:hypothetical protein